MIYDLNRISQFQRESINDIPNSVTRAAVLIPLFVHEDDLYVLLTVRSSKLKSHAGEVCLPGGKKDPSDSDDIETALREANEEIGLEARDVSKVLGLINPTLSKAYIYVQPVVAIIKDDFVPKNNPKEVDGAFSVPLSMFISTKDYNYYDIDWAGYQFRLHEFMADNYRVWGMTAQILIHLAQIVYDCKTLPFELYPEGTPNYVEWTKMHIERVRQEEEAPSKKRRKRKRGP
ncbi:hypothetical protein ROZALSC1DRAFT_29966 [Rozella allomycis CSF55]|uniref:NUDIX hydrolase-like domain-containing protein n=1 Tax=Rozella allomycis (strain CSF55) TaxID=988480 RepID=A0A075B2L9_ROZAC|nr:NUDIX hydrolase-like domain-containing protein [Rozella allomycis CSF55]RKP18330.1 hypothetical protein ROZALSC1DRAFT_29966 [Rozella allomycis CSF55]|eukprot:EPZ36845.1 NUDIX hydrolase-like domain-containing protein [Rozella allomycis CSF55]